MLGPEQSGADAPAHRTRMSGPSGADAPAHRALGAPGTSGQIWVQLSSSMGASVVAALVTTPFDVVKTRMQMSRSQPGVGSAGKGSRCILQSLSPGVDRSVLRACCLLHPESGLLCSSGALAVNAAVEKLQGEHAHPRRHHCLLRFGHVGLSIYDRV